MDGTEWTVVFDKIPEIIAAFHAACAEICKESAEDMARSYTESAPVDTGFLRSSVYVKTQKSSTYGQGLKGDGPMLPEVEKPDNDVEADCAVAAQYGCYQEFGTRFMAAQPAFFPAFDVAQANFQDKLENLETRIKV